MIVGSISAIFLHQYQDRLMAVHIKCSVCQSMELNADLRIEAQLLACTTRLSPQTNHANLDNFFHSSTFNILIATLHHGKQFHSRNHCSKLTRFDRRSSIISRYRIIVSLKLKSSTADLDRFPQGLATPCSLSFRSGWFDRLPLYLEKARFNPAHNL